MQSMSLLESQFKHEYVRMSSYQTMKMAAESSTMKISPTAKMTYSQTVTATLQTQ